MEFAFAIFFLLFYYLRPQDWIEVLAGANLIKPIIGGWVIMLLANRSRPSPLPGFLRTPHDWAVLIYLGYIAFTQDNIVNAVKGVIPLYAFYMLTVQSVNTWPRLLKYLKWWNVALVLIALIAVMSLHGLDLTGARDMTEAFLGRLALGTWLHNNPNSLGHTVVAILPLAYILYFWKGSIRQRLFVYPLLAALAIYCLWKTESKGAYLVGGMLIPLIFVIGRPRLVQFIVLAAAMTLGVSALSFLPRMSQMGDLRSNEGVQGRLMAWEIARTVTRTEPTGEGWRKFFAQFPWKDGQRWVTVTKATHSTYVQIGAELGKYGLFLYVAALWTALHTLLAIKTRDDLQERCRRALFLLLIANVVSGWMINRQYHTENFLLIATAAAMHRLQKGDELEAAKDRPPDAAAGDGDPDPPKAESVQLEPIPVGPTLAPAPAFSLLDSQPAGIAYAKPLWNKFNLLDLGIAIVLTHLTFWTWDYILENI